MQLKRYEYRATKRIFNIYAFLIVVAVICFAAVQFIAQRELNSGVNAFPEMHLIGGFSVDTPNMAMKAASEGVQVIFKYGQPPAENSQLGQKLQALHMQVVDGFISSYLYYYECHRTKTVKPPPSGVRAYCDTDYHPELTNEDAILAVIAAHLQQVKENHLVVGYWVLDDWVTWDAGSAQQLLVKVHQLIQQYTPGRPAICGFGGSISVSTSYGWRDGTAANFSPQGCDMVGLYIYTSSLPGTTVASPPDAYNWSMAGVLPAMFASLKMRGWDITREPLIGIGQAFGGPIRNTNRYWVTPDANDIATQSKSFCEHGATGIVYYGWDDSTFGAGMQTPMNNTGIEMGIQKGIAACKQIWGHSS
jgi:hypothetical protein